MTTSNAERRAQLTHAEEVLATVLEGETGKAQQAELPAQREPTRSGVRRSTDTLLKKPAMLARGTGTALGTH